MEYNNYYLIRYGNDKILVLAKNPQDAVNIWIENKNEQLKKDGRYLDFNPREFSVEELEREDLVIKASK
ncbi:hypothetical protein B4102_0246 [Heyndrickxia sporothermodurans]|uniref:Uncharacterized protein n=1 Tax=Heyndrickxia sporothermodurans TaxID=46224 RepID=A0A150KSD8_9BACI|nr:hypothetical protein [Heyndrickxia sporothermodurans]KYD02652.1 hypothetical protein B4102_0246 [Heyndrickxia sporothermodurans]